MPTPGKSGPGGEGRPQGGDASSFSSSSSSSIKSLSPAARNFVPQAPPPRPPTFYEGRGQPRHPINHAGRGPAYPQHHHHPAHHHAPPHHHQMHNMPVQHLQHHQYRNGNGQAMYAHQQPPQYYQQQQHPYPPPPPPHAQTSQPLRGHELEDALLHQVEYYFSDENLARDKYLLKKMKSGTVPLSFICSFPRVKKLTTDKKLISHVINRSNFIVLSRDGKRLGRKDDKQGENAYRIIEISHLGPETTEESVRKMVQPFGSIVSLEFAWEDEEEAVAAGKTPTHHHAYVEFKEPEAAVRCVEKLAGAGSNWRSGFRTGFLNGFSIHQVAKIYGIKLDESSSSTGGGGGAAGSSIVSETDARLPPVIPEGDHTGVIAELASDGKQGVIKREGRRRSNVSFQVPEGLTLGIGDRVDFTVQHKDGKALVTVVTKATTAAPPSETVMNSTGGGGGAVGGVKAFRMAKGPDGTIGFKVVRTVERIDIGELTAKAKAGGGADKTKPAKGGTEGGAKGKGGEKGGGAAAGGEKSKGGKQKGENKAKAGSQEGRVEEKVAQAVAGGGDKTQGGEEKAKEAAGGGGGTGSSSSSSSKKKKKNKASISSEDGGKTTIEAATAGLEEVKLEKGPTVAAATTATGNGGEIPQPKADKPNESK